MKKNKLFIAFFLLIVIFTCVYAAFVDFEKEEKSYVVTNDTIKFEKEYESLNNVDNGKGNKYYAMSIGNYNKIKYSNYEEVFNLLDNGTGVIYFGFPECPWCRQLVPVLIESAIDTNIKDIYYLNIKEDRDTKELVDDKIITKNEGTEDYQKLVKKLYAYLPAYKGLNNDGIKRIYLPTVVIVKNGKVIKIQESLERYTKRVNGDPYKPMDYDEKQDLYDIFVKYFKKID